MTTLFYYLTILLTCALCFGVWFIFKKRLSTKKELILKILSLVLAGVFCVRYYWGQELFGGIVKLQESPLSNGFLTVVSLLSYWLQFASVLVLVLYAFFKHSILTHFVKFFSLPVSIISILTLVPQLVGIQGSGAVANFSIRIMFYAIEIGICLMYSLYVFLTNKNFSSTKKDWIAFAILIIPALFCVVPRYMFQALFGYGNLFETVKDITPYHRFVLYLSIILPTVIYFALRNKNKNFIKLVLLFISLGTFVIYTRNYTFESLLHPTGWPLHLCNTAMFLIPLCMIFKLNKLFYFTLFINVFGAFIAMAMPNYSDVYMLGTRIVGFWVNHYIAFFMPILMVALKVYERPKLKQFKYSMIGFFMYFAFVLVVNAWFTNYAEVDFFFINSDYVASKLGKWAENLRNIIISFNIGDLTFTFYPVYQFLFFLVYCLLGLAVWFVFEQFFTIADHHFDIAQRKRKIKQDRLALLSQLNGRSEEEPMYEENTNKLIIKDLTKRYSSSDVYAVYKANLEVHGGEIFGFLGPNGAGKSTIIKSIVGIQPITSGEIEICGYDAEKQSVMAKRQIGFVPDHYALYEKLTGREYINYIADLYDVSKEDRDKRIEKYVKLFELEGAFDNQIKTYSHGMKQKITIISALVHNPKVWILDEPLTGLDPNSIFQVKECMKNHAKEGNIVFFSSHIIDVVERICDRITIIKKGQIRATKTIKELDAEGVQLEDFYLSIIENEDNDAIVVDGEKKESLVQEKYKKIEKKTKKDKKTDKKEQKK